MIQCVKNYFLSNLYIWNPYVYAIVGVLLFGIVSGLLGAFTVVISMLVKIKYRVFLFIPCVVLLNLSLYLTVEGGMNYRWYEYLLLFTEEKKSILYFLSVLVVLGICIFLGTRIGAGKDSL